MYKQLLDFMTHQVVTHCVLRVADNAVIPVDPANVDYQKFMVWIKEGNQPLPPDPLPTDPPALE